MLDERYLQQLPALRSRLVRAAARLLGTPAEAEDVVQDAYLRALEATQAPAPASPQAWLTTVMRNLALDRLRRDDVLRRWRQAAGAAQASEAPSAESEAAQAEAVERALRRVADRLSPTDGAALLLREVFEASFKDLAQASGKTEAACRQQMHRTLLRLRQTGHADEDRGDDESAARLQVFRQVLAQCDAVPLLAMLRPPSTRAFSASPLKAAGPTSPIAPTAPLAASQLAHIGGQLCLVLSLGGKVLCVLPLEAEHAEAHAGLAAP